MVFVVYELLARWVGNLGVLESCLSLVWIVGGQDVVTVEDGWSKILIIEASSHH